MKANRLETGSDWPVWVTTLWRLSLVWTWNPSTLICFPGSECQTLACRLHIAEIKLCVVGLLHHIRATEFNGSFLMFKANRRKELTWHQ